MGGSSSPPFLYDPVSQWSFNEYHRGKPYNPKAVTQASRAPRPQRPPQEGPLVSFNRHPDSWVVPSPSPPIVPMSHHTKARVKHTRRFQLLLRILAIIGALGILFCVICVTDTGAALGWIIRVAPCVAILHTIYAIYHLARNAASRPPGTSTSYHLFASCMDAGLVPFYAFTSYIAYREVQGNTYGWNTLFKDATIQAYIVKVLFYATAVCAGLHLISFVISIYLAVVFRQITKLPPDMNPLEDNLTARPSRRSKRSTKSDMTEKKHRSTSTLDSAYYSVRSHMDDAPVDIPEPIPFMHTRQQSSNSVIDPKRASRTSLNSHRQPRIDNAPGSPRSPKQATSPSTPTATRTAQATPPRPRSILEDAPVLHPTPGNNVSANIRWSSPVPSEGSGNWVVYDSRPSSPAVDEDEDNDNMKHPSRSKNESAFPIFNGVSDWLGPVPRYGRVESGTPQKEARGQYAALETNPHIHLDEVFINKDSLEEDITEYLNRALDPLNPLRMNPPTPQPKEKSDNTTTAVGRKPSIRRVALGDIPNVSADRSNDTAAINNVDSPSPTKESKLRTFGSLRLWPSKPNKTTYESVQEEEEEAMSSDNESDNDDNEPQELATPKRRTASKATLNDQTDADRKGRVVSNSGIDLGTAFNTGLSSKQYGDYISGLGVGRRRDVSGKVAEEGRGGIVETTAEVVDTPRTPEKKKATTRAAGWARFAGL
ncbi:hypothetical protein UA08_02936 [Talaromyces atroroseus]|uniref:Uncharacterized protein n=1 Tax=Talaromyces atroroseus TaxID=1441469 RepID=A0A225AMB6_TALAT|nr:hypothetical protein UA08_02936 [Talaromyces atroroseus]OKL62040.1 hypothetical protein UA08_02936 [Talaromyces atroroseus]